MKCKRCGGTEFYDTVMAIRNYDENGNLKSIKIEKYNKVSKYVKCSECGTVASYLLFKDDDFRKCKTCKFYKPYDKPVEDFDGMCIARECETDEEEFCSYYEVEENSK